MSTQATKALISTRKGLMTLAREGRNWRIARTDFLGISVTTALRDAHSGATYAALRHGHFGPKLHRSDEIGRAHV